jgi:methionyl-tRNA synthetase
MRTMLALAVVFSRKDSAGKQALYALWMVYRTLQPYFQTRGPWLLARGDNQELSESHIDTFVEVYDSGK